MALPSDMESLLDGLSRSLDISPTKYKQAVERYTAVGEWLDATNSELRPDLPRVFPQGSFRLGTVVRPVRGGSEQEYDIDLVCELTARTRPRTTPALVKRDVGDRLKSHNTYKRMLDEEKRRCWTLKYSEEDGVGFHVDVLPCVPEAIVNKQGLQNLGVPLDWSERAVALTDKGEAVYGWSAGNPEGYARWFESINLAASVRVAERQKTTLYESNKQLYASVSEVPDQLVRSPLQRVVQILKRHRDQRFDDTRVADCKPISIIITTIAARIFQGEGSTASTLENLIRELSVGLSARRFQRASGEWHIPNPVNPDENFADKWNEDGGARASCFRQWVEWLSDDIQKIRAALGTSVLEERVRDVFGASYSRMLQEEDRSFGESRGMNIASALQRPVVSGSFFDQDHREAPAWPVQLSASATVSAKVKGDGFRERTISSNEPALGKRLGLYFTVRTDVQGSYRCCWQVVNTGDEARSAGQLRGGFVQGGDTHYERTLYKGKHWVQCFIVKHGVCVAVSKEFIVNIV